MGADVYLMSVYKPARDAAEPAFYAACAKRDQLIKAGKKKQADKVQEKEIGPAWEAMYPKDGYFRDPYNGTAFFWKIGLSWWRDVTPLLTKQRKLPIRKAKWLREEVAKRPLDLEEVAKAQGPDTTLEEVVKYYEEDRAALVALLDKSIELREPLVCSL